MAKNRVVAESRMEYIGIDGEQLDIIARVYKKPDSRIAYRTVVIGKKFGIVERVMRDMAYGARDAQKQMLKDVMHMHGVL